MYYTYGRPAGRVVRICGTPARIMNVTQEHVEFIDEEGVLCLIDLERCRRNYDARFIEGLDDGYRGVGLRGPHDRPPWMSFTDEPPTMFEFLSTEDLHLHILDPLVKFGWITFGTD